MGNKSTVAGLVTIKSSNGPEETMNRFEAEVRGRGRGEKGVDPPPQGQDGDQHADDLDPLGNAAPPTDSWHRRFLSSPAEPDTHTTHSAQGHRPRV